MNIIDNSNHICLICDTTIVGLLQYVEHFKSHAIPDETYEQEQKPLPVTQLKNEQLTKSNRYGPNETELVKSDSAEIASHSLSHTPHETNVYCNENSPLSAFTGQDFQDPDIDTDTLLSPKYNVNFFQSLELKSTNEEVPAKPKVKATQKLSILEDDTHAECLLPITSILSNIDFSSDEEEGFECTGEELQDKGWSEDDDMGDEVPRNPPRTHTGGKWKPGQGPIRGKKLPIAGKWKPGLGPASRKNIMRKRKKIRGPRADVGKDFHCNVCNEHFPDRSAYSLHFGEQKHKDALIKRRLMKENSQLLNPARVAVTGVQQDVKLQGGQIPVKRKGNEERYHCPVCDLYFSSAMVFQMHCDTKVHKDGLLKQGFKEYRSADGLIIRIDVHSDAIFTERQENQLMAARQPKKAGPTLKAEEEKHECNVCRKVFKRKYEMARHLLTRMHRVRAESKPMEQWVEMLEKYNKYMIRLSLFQCSICQFYFNRQHDFLDHMCSPEHVQTCEDMIGPIMCVACRYKTHVHAEMMFHLHSVGHFTAVERAHGLCIIRESHTKITCKFCGIMMHSAARIKRHCKLRHADRLSEVQETMDVRPMGQHQHQCPLCDKCFKVKSMLQMHFLKSHKHRAVFECTICSRGFLDQRRLDNHLRTRYHAKRAIAVKLNNRRQQKKQGTKKEAEKKSDADTGEVGESNNTVTGEDKAQGVGEEVQDVDSVPNEEKDEDEKGIDTAEHDDGAGGLKMDEDSRQVVGEGDLQTGNSDVGQERPDENIRNVEAARNDSNVVGSVTSSENLRRSSRKRKVIEFDDASESEPGESDVGVKKLKSKTGKMKSVFLKNPPLKEEKIKNQEEDDEEEEELYNEDGNAGFVKTSLTIGGKKKKIKEGEYDKQALDEVSKKVFSCPYCGFCAVDLLELRHHYNENHPLDILMCQPCNQYFLSLKAYKIHCAGRGHQLKLRELSGETTMHKCPLCDKRFLQQTFCTFHIETVHRHPNSETDIQRINKGTDLVTQLYGEHVAQVQKLSNDSSVSCPECGKFVRKDTLVEHLRVHTGEKPYSCRFCKKSFAGRLTLRRHISSHLDMPLFMCDLCGKEFKRNAHLIKHLRQHDNEKKGMKQTCQVCQTFFYTPEELTRHMRRHGERNYPCTWPGCNWTFVLAGELKSHMYSHTKERKYLCDMCGFGAPTKTRLRRHARTHENSRNFVCEYCPYKATLKTHLKRHMRIHINSKPYACPYCNYTCNTHENIRKHILKTQKHKGKKLYPCKLCSDFGCDTSREFKGHLMTIHAEYLRENCIDSMSIFSGLYKKDEDYQKPKEGSEIIQVTKGRFFRNYQNPGSVPPPPKNTKVAKKKKKENPEMNVRVVTPAELEGQALREQDGGHIQSGIASRTHSVIITPQEQIITVANIDQQQVSSEQVDNAGLEMTVDEEVASISIPQYVEVPNMIIQETFNISVSGANNTHQIFPVAFSVAASVQDQEQHQQQQQQQQQQEHQELQHQLQQLQTSGVDEKVFWVEAAADGHVLPSCVNTQTTSASPDSESWYSGIPQVHAPTCQDINNLTGMEVGSDNDNQPAQSQQQMSAFSPSKYFSVTAPQIYNTGENRVVVLDEVASDL